MLILTIAGQALAVPLKAAPSGGDLGTELVRTLNGTVYAVETGPASPLTIEVDGGTSPCAIGDARRILGLHQNKTLFDIQVRSDLGDLTVITGCRIIERPTLTQIGRRGWCTYKLRIATGVTAWI